MATDEEIFEKSGPVYLTKTKTPDWSNTHYRRSVAASLVQGVYVRQSDLQQKRSEHEFHAPAWWRSFHFDVHEELVDDVDSSTFGAIYKFNGSRSTDSPRFVIAFRGTVFKSATVRRDIKLNIKIAYDRFHRKSRYEIALRAVKNTVDGCGSSSEIWLAGHSSGSFLAMLVGKDMALEGIYLNSFLFNPPFVSVPLEKLKDGKYVFRIVWSLMTAAIAVLVDGSQRRKSSEELFRALSSWVPSLFVNSHDPICYGYELYFESRRIMKKLGLGRVEDVATRYSIVTLLSQKLGSGREYALPARAIPSGTLVVRLNGSPEIEQVLGIQRLKHPITYVYGKWKRFRQAHGICQWWRSDLHLETYHYE